MNMSPFSDERTAKEQNAASTPVDDVFVFPTSFAQQRLWFVQQLQPDSVAYNIVNAICLTGTLRLMALEQSLNEMMRRHEILRTTFSLVDGQPVQVIHPNASISFPIVDLHELGEVERDAVIKQIAQQEFQQPFNLAQGPLLRFRLLRLSEQKHILLFFIHHIIFDGWSMTLFQHELSLCYTAATQRLVSSLPELPIQYADYAIWQRQWLQDDVLTEQLTYWKHQLEEAPTTMPLLADHSRPVAETQVSACYRFTFPPKLLKDLKALSQQEDATLFMTLLAAFQALLFRYTGQEDLLIGTPVAGRTRTETEGLIGCFINMLVLRTDLAGNPSFSETLRRTRKTTLEAFAHQELPFERLVEELQPVRDLRRTPLVQIVFSLQNAPKLSLNLPGLISSPLEIIDREVARFDFVLDLQETPAGMSGSIKYNTDLFEKQTIAQMAAHYQRLLEGIVADPSLSLAELPMLSQTEIQLLAGKQAHLEDFSQPECIHQLFEEQVARTPEAIAVVFEDQQLTYSALNGWANRLAYYLQTQTIGPDVRIGILMERGIEIVIGLLGILKAGGAYVPFDPTHPADRLAALFKNAQVSVILTQVPFQPQLSGHDVQIIYLDTCWQTLSKQSWTNPDSGVQAANVAYIIHTSGSTGEPKGVMISHQNVTRLFAATKHWFSFNPQDAWTLFHSFAFDFSVWELWGALLHGGRLVIVSYWMSRSPEMFLDLLRREQVTVLNQTPSAFRQLVQLEETAKHLSLLSLRLLIFGGEALDFRQLHSWLTRYGDHPPQLINMYGITETTVHVTFYPLAARDAIQTSQSVIGQAIPDLDLYVLDAYLWPVPVGVPGELYVGGAGLARGYLNRPDLTAERFIPHPYSSRPGDRLYRTGDLVYYQSDNNLVYLRRNDRQVKVRGFRFELGEIEALLRRHSHVHDALVLVDESIPDKKRLIAYIVPDPGQTFTSEQLYSVLRPRLPEYMIPAAFVILDALPLTSNGKVDRQALLALTGSQSALQAHYEAPQTYVEAILDEIWADVLGVERVGIHDNFFALGGDSIRSVRLLALAKDKGLDISLQRLFQRQTIHELAQDISPEEIHTVPIAQSQPFTLLSAENRQKLPPELEDAYPLTMLQMGMLFHSENNPGTALYHDISCSRITAPFDDTRLRNALQQIMLRHPVLRTSFDLSNFTESLQLVHRDVSLPLSIEDLRSFSSIEQEQMLASWLDAEKKRKFDWTHAPLLRVQIHRLSEEAFSLAIAFHHSILDGWSFASMLTELLQCYMSLVEKDTPLVKPALTTLFRDFVALEREALISDVMRQYWIQKLADITCIRLPRWVISSQSNALPEVRERPVPFSQKLSDGLKNIAKALDVPLKSVLLAAHLSVLSVISGQRDILTGLVSNGRLETTDGEQALGLFLNTLPYRQQMSRGSWKELVRKTFENEQELLPYRRYPLARIQQEQGGAALFEILFNFIHFHVYRNLQELRGLHILEETSIEHTDLTLSAEFSLDASSSRIGLSLRYDPTQLCDEQIQAMACYYSNALTALVTNPDADYTTTSLLADHETQQLLYAWNDTDYNFGQEESICDLFETYVEQTPDAIAACIGDAQITYQELNCLSNQCARYLQGLGVGPEVTVGLCVEASLEMLISLWGILKAGGAYVPLEPDLPQQRLLTIIRDANVAVIITQDKFAQRYCTTTMPLVRLHADWTAITAVSPSQLVRKTYARNAAYVLYTSGSTGRPKGVVVEHRQLLNYTRSIIQRLDLASASRFALLHPLSVDFGVTTLFPALCVGGSISLLPREHLTDPQAITSFMQSRGIDCLKITPSHLAALQVANHTGRLMPLRLLILGGESFQGEWATALYAEAPECSIVSHYGPTETTVGVLTYQVLEGESSLPVARVPLGRPLDNTQIYLFNSYLEPVPVGVAGELYIGGANVARGYLGQADMTAESFLPDPFSIHPGARLYRTGDLARYLPDGLIEFLGRKDDQVKVRGYRVELGEVANILRHHAAVRDAVVLAHTENLDKRLVAYVVADEAMTLTSEELSSYLRTQVPEYMVPAAFVFMEKLPLLSNGKVDRRQLASLTVAQEHEKSLISFVAPRTPIEMKLAAIWAELLKVERVGINDKFFELGGHSLLAMQVISRIRVAFQVDLSIRSLFECQTIAHLALAIELAQMTKDTNDPLLQALAAIERISDEEARQMMKSRNLSM